MPFKDALKILFCRCVIFPIKIFDPFDEVVLNQLNWIRNNYMDYKGTAGWIPIQSASKAPYTWSTARCLYGLAKYREAVSIEEFTNEKDKKVIIGDRWQVVNKRSFRSLLIALTIIITLLYSIVLYKIFEAELFTILSKPVKIRSIFENLIFWIIPILLVWGLSMSLIKRGNFNLLGVFESLKKGLSKIKLW